MQAITCEKEFEHLEYHTITLWNWAVWHTCKEDMLKSVLGYRYLRLLPVEVFEASVIRWQSIIYTEHLLQTQEELMRIFLLGDLNLHHAC